MLAAGIYVSEVNDILNVLMLIIFGVSLAIMSVVFLNWFLKKIVP